jgi:hypothetical protein
MSDFRIATRQRHISSLTQAKSDLAIQGLRNPSTKDSPSKIDKAAHDFESILVGQWLEKAEKSFATVPGRPGSRPRFRSRPISKHRLPVFGAGSDQEWRLRDRRHDQQASDGRRGETDRRTAPSRLRGSRLRADWPLS